MSEEIKNQENQEETEATETNQEASTQPTQEEMAANTKKIMDDRQMILKLAESSKIADTFGKKKIVFIDKDRATKYALELTYPGSIRASDIIQQSYMSNGQYSFRTLMNEAIKDVITLPHIKDVAAFWDHHTNFGEAAVAVFNFLNDVSEGTDDVAGDQE